MSDGQFTAKAALLWGTIPKEARGRILANVFCVKCRRSVTIITFTGEELNEDVRAPDVMTGRRTGGLDIRP